MAVYCPECLLFAPPLALSAFLFASAHLALDPLPVAGHNLDWHLNVNVYQKRTSK